MNLLIVSAREGLGISMESVYNQRENPVANTGGNNSAHARTHTLKRLTAVLFKLICCSRHASTQAPERTEKRGNSQARKLRTMRAHLTAQRSGWHRAPSAFGETGAVAEDLCQGGPW